MGALGNGSSSWSYDLFYSLFEHLKRKENINFYFFQQYMYSCQTNFLFLIWKNCFFFQPTKIILDLLLLLLLLFWLKEVVGLWKHKKTVFCYYFLKKVFENRKKKIVIKHNLNLCPQSFVICICTVWGIWANEVHIRIILDCNKHIKINIAFPS